MRLDYISLCNVICKGNCREFEGVEDVKAGKGEIGGCILLFVCGEWATQLHGIDVLVESFGETRSEMTISDGMNRLTWGGGMLG